MKKTFREYTLDQSTRDEIVAEAIPDPLPAVLVFKRRVVRTLTAGHQVGEYECEQLGTRIIYPPMFTDRRRS